MSSRASVFLASFWTIPSLIQIALLEILATGILGGVVAARLADHWGWTGHPPNAPLSWSLVIWFGVGALFMWLTLRDIWNPGVTRQSYSPVRKLGPIMIIFDKDPAGYSYQFLGSHPGYILMDAVAATIPLTLTIYSWGDDPVRIPTMHVYHWWLIVWAVVPAARLFCWYGLGRGPDIMRALRLSSKSGASPIRPGDFDFYFWSGPVFAWTIALVFVVPGLWLGVRDGRDFDKTIPVLTGETIRAIYGVPRDLHRDIDDPSNHDEQRFRIVGTLRGEVKHWPGGGGEKLNSLGFVIVLDDGAEVAVFADEINAKVIDKALARGNGKTFTCLVRTLHDGGKEISEHYKRYFNWNETDLGPPAEASNRYTGGPRRILTHYVDP